ncbi:RNA polymerase sigma-70 factor, ECF subfamily [Jatrophihabitans endophyticus]|uniref:RNA polymerase sigma-70 factor, ECF subfamily n=1 Tax=Jatrophihabitans endophyticus TaxID=1206085 RepID=A0A1M5PIT9_9ACTN|nr:RNA polymerase sigma factor [Jatrophihabitans endophyticus]SHH01637.1 RNA polymerase sigma-70 factor, ECF subfamily [Jatrophihabitans endophyticus]
MSDSVDEDVLAAAQRGSEHAFALIWRELSPSLLGYLAARGVPDPEGTASDVFVTLFRRLGELTGGVAGLRTFVFSVAHARAVDEHRRRSRRPAAVEFDRDEHDGVVGAAASAEDEALHRSSTARAFALLGRLAPDHREVLALRVVGDLSLEQTAAVMGRSVGSIKQLQRRALQALRAELGDQPAERAGVTARGAGAMTQS